MLLKSFFNTQFIFMQQDTKSKFAAILAAAQAKEAAKQQPTTQPQAPAPATAAKIITTPKPEPGKIYNLMGAGGAIMQEIKRVKLPLFCTVHLIGSEGNATAATIAEENDNGQQRAVVLSEHRPRFIMLDIKYMQPYSKKFGIGNYYDDNFNLISAETVSKYIALATEAAQPKPAPTQAPAPELSTMTSADLLNTTEAPVMCTPIAFELPAIQTQPEPAPQEKPARKIQIIDYSEKAIAVIGETKEIRHILKSLGGKYNSFLSCGKGWIFSKKQLDNVKTELLKLQ